MSGLDSPEASICIILTPEQGDKPAETMIEPVLFITAGAALYGGVSNLYRGATTRSGRPYILHAVMFFLLAGFALSGTVAGRVNSLTEFAWFVKLSVSLGMLLFAGLPWFIAQLLHQHTRVLPALLTLAWGILLMINIASPYSLLYQDVSTTHAVLESGQPSFDFTAESNPAWQLVELAMLGTLLYAMYLCVKPFHRTAKQLPVAPATGLVLLLCTTIFDFFVYAGLAHSAYLAPMGFLLFLVAAALHRQPEPVVVDQPEQTDSDRYQITLNFNPAHEEKPPAKDIEVAAETEADIAQLSHQRVEPAAAPSVHIDNPTVNEVSDSLVDIAVDATLILKRLEQGNIDPEELTNLGRKVRTRAIETRRITHRMMRRSHDPEDP